MASSTPSYEFSLQTIYASLTSLNACKTTSLILGLHMIQVGLWVFYDPASCVKAFGLRLDGRPYHSASTASDSLKKKAQQATSNDESSAGNFWTLLFAPREAGFGFLLLVFAALGEWKSVGITTAVVAGLLATTDGVASGWYGKDGWPGAVKGHGIPAVLLGFVAAGLLYL